MTESKEPESSESAEDREQWDMGISDAEAEEAEDILSSIDVESLRREMESDVED
jgi:hypothetical protein